MILPEDITFLKESVGMCLLFVFQYVLKPFPWYFIISLPVPGKRNFWPGIKTGNTIIICSLADGW